MTITSESLSEALRTLLPAAGNAELVRLSHEEDDEPYDVWLVSEGERRWILKKAKGAELSAYREMLPDASYAPRFFGSTMVSGEDYILIEYVLGSDLRKCTHEGITAAVVALAEMQNTHWQGEAGEDGGFLASVERRARRGSYLNDPVLEAAYADFMAAFCSTPRTLCHDDLLPFNVIVSERRAVFIDWETFGLLPYPTSIARLLAHGTESPGAFFFMPLEEKEYAARLYYELVAKKHGISYENYRTTLELFMYYEYCEWVYVGNRYDARDGAYFQSYLPIATAAAEHIITAR